MSNDLGLLMQMTELTADDKAVLWNNYQKAMVSLHAKLATTNMIKLT